MFNRVLGGHLDTSLSTPLHRKQREEISYFKDRYGCPLINPGPYLRQRQFSYNKDGARYMAEEDKEGASRTKTSIDGTSGPLTYEYLKNCEDDG